MYLWSIAESQPPYTQVRNLSTQFITETPTSETILDFQDGLDALGLIGGLNFSQLSIVAENNSTPIRVTGSGQLLATLGNVPTGLITATDFAII